MVGVKRKRRRARTSEGQDSRAMPYTVYFGAINVEALLQNGSAGGARRLHAIWGLGVLIGLSWLNQS